MKRKNYKWNFANSIISKILVPIYGVMATAITLLLIVLYDNKFKTIMIIDITFLVMLLPSYFVFVLVGSIMFKQHSFIQDDNYFYQGKRKLSKTNLFTISIGTLHKIDFVNFIPCKNGVFKSCQLIYYFFSTDEMANFLIKNHLLCFISPRDYEYIDSYIVSRGIKYDEAGKAHLDRYKCPCCGNKTFFEKPNHTFNICPVCFWEDDEFSIENPDITYDCNKVSLNQARINYKEYKACRIDLIEFVREPYYIELPQEEEKSIVQD